MVSKDQLKNRFAVIKKASFDAEKARQAAQITEAVDEIKKYIESNPESRLIIKSLPGLGNKAVTAVVNHVKSAGLNGLFIYADGDKVSYVGVLSKVSDPSFFKKTFSSHVALRLFFFLQDTVAKGFKASDWVSKIAEVFNGKCGGKDEQAQGAGSDASKVDQALALAKDLISPHL